MNSVLLSHFLRAWCTAWCCQLDNSHCCHHHHHHPCQPPMEATSIGCHPCTLKGQSCCHVIIFYYTSATLPPPDHHQHQGFWLIVASYKICWWWWRRLTVLLPSLPCPSFPPLSCAILFSLLNCPLSSFNGNHPAPAMVEVSHPSNVMIWLLHCPCPN